MPLKGHTCKKCYHFKIKQIIIFNICIHNIAPTFIINCIGFFFFTLKLSLTSVHFNNTLKHMVSNTILYLEFLSESQLKSIEK